MILFIPYETPSLSDKTKNDGPKDIGEVGALGGGPVAPRKQLPDKRHANLIGSCELHLEGALGLAGYQRRKTADLVELQQDVGTGLCRRMACDLRAAQSESHQPAGRPAFPGYQISDFVAAETLIAWTRQLHAGDDRDCQHEQVVVAPEQQDLAGPPGCTIWSVCPIQDGTERQGRKQH